jgi:hypothetical protein
MNDDFEVDLEGWEPKTAEPNLDGWKKHAFREDPKAKQRRAMCVPAKSRRYDCPNCGIARNVEPTYSGEEWHYFGQCSHCGQTWVNAYHLMVKCEDCGTKVAITSRNPEGLCRCRGETRRPF